LRSKDPASAIGQEIEGIIYPGGDDILRFKTDNLYASQDFFGDLATVTFGYSLSQDDVTQNGNPDFAGRIDRHNFRVGLSQIVTPELVMSLNYELVQLRRFSQPERCDGDTGG